MEMSRSASAEQRNDVMNLCSTGKIAILVSSDQMARGIDLPNINLVINYDTPKHAKTYVHRVGRTARAGRYGHAITILKEGQVGIFKKMRSSISSANKQLSGRDNHTDSARENAIDYTETTDMSTTHTDKKRRVDVSDKFMSSCRVNKLTMELAGIRYTESLKIFSADINSGGIEV